MTTPWREPIRSALANPALQEALQANARRRKAAWSRAMRTLPVPWEEARKRAAAIREYVLEHWDVLLERFLAQVQRHGVVVHRASDARAAREVVLALAREHRVRLAVKSKSMLTEEIGLNEALEAAGIEVVETDLGEFIVQLRREKPAHIITPAVHLRRQDVGRLLQQHLGIPYTEDVAQMTRAVRAHLREKFRTADMGISGVNFGVAETGTLALVTNEGNGRMVTTAPRLHVAVMGMERLVPTMADLAWMLRLLPRAATGQTLTAYVSLLHGPRGPQDPDGPQQRHLVLVDNGRRHLAETPLADILRCIRCGACLNACPVFARLGGHGYRSLTGAFTPYPGPMGAVVSPGLFGPEYGNLAYLCTLCAACAEVCPVGIPLPEAILQVRRGEGIGRGQVGLPAPIRLGLQAYARLTAHPGLYRAARGLATALLPRMGGMVGIPLLRGAAYRHRHPLPAPRRASGESPGQAGARPEPAPSAPTSPSDPVARFLRQAQQVDVETHTVARDRLPHALTAWCRENGIRTLWPWAGQALPPGVLDALREHGLRLHPDPDADAGLTGVLWAVAETGTLVLPSGPGRPLGASLWPPVHLAIVERERIVPRLENALTDPRLTQGPAAVLVTGPSRTADIEMTLTLGVHGPGRVVVFVIEP